MVVVVGRVVGRVVVVAVVVVVVVVALTRATIEVPGSNFQFSSSTQNRRKKTPFLFAGFSSCA